MSQATLEIYECVLSGICLLYGHMEKNLNGYLKSPLILACDFQNALLEALCLTRLWVYQSLPLSAAPPSRLLWRHAFHFGLILRRLLKLTLCLNSQISSECVASN